MTWMNEMDVEDAFDRYYNDPVLGPAVLTLRSLVNWTNSHSDGWPYWSKPGNAAKALMALVQRHQEWERKAFTRPRPEPVTQDEVARALRPIKAFRTRQGADFVIVEA